MELQVDLVFFEIYCQLHPVTEILFIWRTWEEWIWHLYDVTHFVAVFFFFFACLLLLLLLSNLQGIDVSHFIWCHMTRSYFLVITHDSDVNLVFQKFSTIHCDCCLFPCSECHKSSVLHFKIGFWKLNLEWQSLDPHQINWKPYSTCIYYRLKRDLKDN